MTKPHKFFATEQFLSDCELLEPRLSRRLLQALADLLRKTGGAESLAAAEQLGDARQHKVAAGLSIRYRNDRGDLVLVDASTHNPQAIRHPSTRTYQLSLEQLRRILQHELHPGARFELLKLVLHLTREQETLVGLPASGHRWIKGESGSGKTTVAVRRAIHLARQGLLHGRPRVLLLLPTAPLCKTFSKAIAGVALEVATLVHVATCRDFVKSIIHNERPDVRIMDKQTYLGLTREAVRLASREEPHPLWQRPAGFFAREFDEVLLTHDIHVLDRYRQFPREGLRHRLDARAREVLWRAWEHFLELRRSHGTRPWPQAVEQVRLFLNTQNEIQYDHVVVDDAQSLRAVELKLCRDLALTGGLTLLSDTEPHIARPGSHWRSLDLNFSGRTHRLPRNRRSNHQISAFARNILWTPHQASRHRSDTIQAREESGLLFRKPYVEQPPLPFSGVVTGASPKLLVCRDWKQELSTVANKARQRIQNGVRPGSIAVLSRHRHFLERLATVLHEQATDHALLQSEEAELDDVLAADAVKLIPLQAAVGLEFPIVFLTDVNQGVLPATEADDLNMDADTSRRLLYLGATRAIEELWISACAETVSPLLPEMGNGNARVTQAS